MWRSRLLTFCNFRPPKLPKFSLLSRSLSRFSLALCKLTWQVSVRCYKLSPPSSHNFFLSFFLEDKTSGPDVFSSCSLILCAHLILSQVQWCSVSMATRYDFIGGRWSSRIWVRVHVFSTFFNYKSKSCG